MLWWVGTIWTTAVTGSPQRGQGTGSGSSSVIPRAPEFPRSSRSAGFPAPRVALRSSGLSTARVAEGFGIELACELVGVSRQAVILERGHGLEELKPGALQLRCSNLSCDTAVSHHMSTDADVGDDRMRKINVRVPESLLEQIDEEWERRGYSSKSEAIRDALRDWVQPSTQLSEETVAALETSRKQAARGETRSLDAVADKYGVDLEES